MRSTTPTAVGAGGIRRVAASAAVVVAGVGGLTACSELADPDRNVVTIADLQEVRDDLGRLDERVTAIEEEGPFDARAGSGADIDDSAGAVEGFGEDAEWLEGQQVTVRGQVTEVLARGDAGTALVLERRRGEPLPVVTNGRVRGLQVDDVVKAAGIITMVQRDAFEEQFGVMVDDVFSDPGSFFDVNEGEIALAATSVTVVEPGR